MTHADRPIQLDASFAYQQAAMHAIHRALIMTHGSAFADAFIHEHHQAVTKAARTRVCGRSEAAVASEAQHLDRAYRGL
nr:hypothetical protein [uncultured Duganella sp.]